MPEVKAVIATAICAALSFALSAQELVPALKIYDSFEVPKNEMVRLVHVTPAGVPVVISTTDDAIFLRPADPTSGLPTRLLAIRSNQTKRVKEFEIHGDSIICLVQSVEESRRGYETVIYTLRNNTLSEATRRQVRFAEAQSKKNAQPVHFSVSANGKWSLVARQLAYSRNKNATLHVEMCKYPEDSVARFDLPLPYEADDVSLLSMLVADDGMMYFTAKTGVKLNSPFLSKWLLYSFNPRTEELHEFDATVNKVFPNEMVMSMTDEGLWMAAPYSTNPFKTRDAAGFLWVALNKDGTQVANKTVQPFLPSLKAPFMVEDSRDEEHLPQISLRSVLSVSGTPTLVLAQSYTDQICTTDPRTGIMTCTDQYYHNGILISSPLNQAQSLVLERRQLDYNNEGPYLGDQSFTYGPRLYTLYNDHSKNEGLQAQRVMNNPGRAALRFVAYRPMENIQTGILEQTSSQDQVFLATIPPFIHRDKAYVIYSNGRDYSVATIDLRILENQP